MPAEIKCEICGKIFIARMARYKYCSDECRKEAIREKNRYSWHQKERARKSKRRAPREGMSVHEVIVWIREYYEKTGVMLSYGKAVAKIEKEKGAVNDGP